MNKNKHKLVLEENSLFGLGAFKNRIGYSLFLLAFSFVLYGNTIGNEYAIDDPIVTNNEITRQGIGAIPHIFTSRYRVVNDYNYGYRPIAKSTFAIEYELFGENPHISHFINVLIYALIGIFLFFLLAKFLREYHTLFPLIITVLFIAHPIHTEAVASLKNREELLSFLGCIVSLYFLVRYIETRRVYNIMFGLLCYVFAFLSKQNAITFAAVIPLSVYFFANTSFQSSFFNTARAMLSNTSVRVLRFFKSKATSVFFGLLGYYLAVMAWYYTQYLYTLLLFFPTLILLGRASLMGHAERKEAVASLVENKIVLIWCVIYCLAIALRQSIYFEMPLGRNFIIVSVALSGAFLIKYFFKWYSDRNSSQRAFAMYQYAFMIFFCYIFPFFHQILIQVIIAGILPVWYFVLSKTSAEVVPTSSPAKSTQSLQNISLIDLAKTISNPTWLLLSGALILWVTSYGVLFGPDQFLPPEQRELHYFENPLLFNTDLGTQLGTSMYALLVYLKLLVLPHPLVFYYGFNHIPLMSISNGWAILSVLIHSFLLVFALLKFRKRHLLSFAILYYLLTIFVYSNIALKIPGIVGERLLFMPSLGFCMAITFLAFKLLRIDPKLKSLPKSLVTKLLLVISLIVVPYSIKTIARNSNWKNNTTLYLHDIPYLENSLHANALVGGQMLLDIDPNPQSQAEIERNRERVALARKHFEQVLVIDPKQVKTLNNLGRVYFEFYQDYGKAVDYFEQAVKIESPTAEAMFNIGQCYEQLNKAQAAKTAYLISIKMDSDYVNSFSSLANLYFKMGMQDSALFLNDRLVEIDPLLDMPYVNVGNYYLQMNNEAEAVSMFEKAVELNPANNQLCLALADYFTAQNDLTKAAYYSEMSRGEH